MATEIPRRLLEYLAEGLVDEPEAVSVEQFEEDDGTIVLELCVAADDYGRVIGRGGRTPHALDGSFYVTRPIARLLRTGARVTVAGRALEIVRRAGTDARPIVRLAGI